MPELPDVEVFRRRLAATGLHRRIDRVRVHDSSLPRAVSRRHLQQALTGRELQRTRRHGKQLFAAVSGGDWLVLHFGMTGLLDYHRDGEPDDDHTRLTLRFEDGSRVAYVDQRRLGFVTLMSNLDAYVEDEPLGPDALALSPGALRDLLRERRGAVKSVLMDPSRVSATSTPTRSCSTRGSTRGHRPGRSTTPPAGVFTARSAGSCGWRPTGTWTCTGCRVAGCCRIARTVRLARAATARCASSSSPAAGRTTAPPASRTDPCPRGPSASEQTVRRGRAGSACASCARAPARRPRRHRARRAGRSPSPSR